MIDEATRLKNNLLVLSLFIAGKLHTHNASTDYLYDITSLASGYYIIGIIGVTINSGSSTALVHCNISNNQQLKIRVYNVGSTDVTSDGINVKLLYSKYKPTYV